MSLDTCLLHLLCHPPSPYCRNICLCDFISYCSLHTQVECGINLALPIHRTKFPQFRLRCTRKTATSLAHHSTFLCSMTPFSLAIISFHSSAVCHIVVFYNLFITLMLFHILIFLIKNFYGIFLLLFLLSPSLPLLLCFLIASLFFNYSLFYLLCSSLPCLKLSFLSLPILQQRLLSVILPFILTHITIISNILIEVFLFETSHHQSPISTLSFHLSDPPIHAIPPSQNSFLLILALPTLQPTF